MSLEQSEKELVAIGASIGANCRPCIEYHIAAARTTGLTDAELNVAVATAHAVRREAVALLAARIDELLGNGGAPPEPAAIGHPSKAHELVALGASVGSNSHALLRLHITASSDIGLASSHIRSALKMAEYVQQHASDLTAAAAVSALAGVTDLRTEAATT